MSPIKIILLAVLFYFLFKLVTAGKNKPSVNHHDRDAKTPPDDILVEDPFCHTYIPQKEAEKLILKGKPYYFCSKKCLKSFQENK
nr:YHS domain-containing protein [Desulfobulbaceae bacterium]